MTQQTAIITGGSSGIGEACCDAFLKKGMLVYSLDRQPPKKSHERQRFIECDVTSEESVTKSVGAVEGTVSVLVNCAGVADARRLASKKGPHELERFKRIININLIGTFNVARIVAHRMITQQRQDQQDQQKQGGGVIINIASIAAFDGEGGQVAYAASKAGVVGMTLPAARDLRKFGIRVVTIAPGLVKTPMAQGLTPEVEAMISENILFPQRLATAAELASVVVAVVDNIYINGTVLRVDAGLRLSGL